MFSLNLMKFEVPDTCMRFMEAELGEKEEEKINCNIMNHHFNTKIILHIPDTPSVPNSIMGSLSDDTSFYCIKNLLIQELCEYQFIKTFVENGNVYAYTSNTRLDIDNCAAFVPSGSLFLLVDNFKYHELGIGGKLSSHILRTPKNKYIIEIDTKAQGFIPINKLYQRTHAALAACPLHFDFYLNWIPKDASICPSSIAKYFHDRGYDVEEIESSMRQTLHTDVTIPRVFGEGREDLEPSTLMEWLGMHALEVDTATANTFAPEPHLRVPSLNVCHIEGFFPPSQVKGLIGNLRNWLHEREEDSVPWISMTVLGPSDGLISWAKSEHSFKSNGENLFVVLVGRNHTELFSVEETKKPQRFYAKTSN